MKAFDRVRVLGSEGDAAQFGVFKFPHGCMLFIEGWIDGRVVSLNAERYPRDKYLCGYEVERAGVAEAYIGALRGRGVCLPENKTTRQLKRGLMSWLRVAEAYTGASPLALAWTGSIVFRNLPRFRFALQRTPENGTVMMTLEIAMAVSVRFTEKSTPVPAATKVGPLLGSEVLNAISRIVNPKTKCWQDMRRSMDALLQQYEFKDIDLGHEMDKLMRVPDERNIPDNIRRCVLRARPRCALCWSCIKDMAMTDELDEKCSVRLEFISVCRTCVASPVRLRSWASTFKVELATEAPTETRTEHAEHVRFGSSVELEHTEHVPGRVYYAQCRAIPVLYKSIWQRTACFVSAAEMVLRDNKTGALRHLSRELIDIIMWHLMSEVMPPSRALFEKRSVLSEHPREHPAYTPTQQEYSPTSPRYTPVSPSDTPDSAGHAEESDWSTDSYYWSSDENGADDEDS